VARQTREVIETELWASPANSQTFDEEHIGRNNLIIWPCDITYPVPEELFSQLSHLGTFSGKIPHEELFPLGTERKRSKFMFRLALRPDPDSHLLMGDFSIWLKDGRLCELRDVRYIPLPLVPRSHYENQIRLKDLQTLDSSVEAPSTSGQRSPVSAEGSLSPRRPRADVIRTRARSQPVSVIPQSPLQSGDTATTSTRPVTSDRHRRFSPRPGLVNQSWVKPLPLQTPSRKVLAKARSSRRQGLPTLKGLRTHPKRRFVRSSFA
jgi:hypothetical protein